MKAKEKMQKAQGYTGHSHATVSAKVVMLTPERATELMERNTLNRDISQRWANDLKEMIEQGRWRLTQDAVAVSLTGRVLNGQHRLWAIIESGSTVPVLLAEGFSDDAQFVMDVGRKRTAYDAIKVSGRPGTRVTTMIVARMAGYGMNAKHTMHNDEIGPLHDRYHEAAEFAASAFKSAKRPLFHVSVMAVVARAFYMPHSRHRVLEFVEALVTGSKDPEDSAAVRLRDLLATVKGNGGRAWSTEVYRKTETALKAFVAKKPLAKLYEAVEEQYPIPK